MARIKKHSSKSVRRKTRRKRVLPYPSHIKSTPRLRSIFSRIRTGRSFKFSQFTHFIASLVEDFKAAAVNTWLRTSRHLGLSAANNVDQQSRRLHVGLPMLSCAQVRDIA